MYFQRKIYFKFVTFFFVFSYYNGLLVNSMNVNNVEVNYTCPLLLIYILIDFPYSPVFFFNFKELDLYDT